METDTDFEYSTGDGPETDDMPFGIDDDLDYGAEYESSYEDYEPSPYDGTYSEE